MGYIYMAIQYLVAIAVIAVIVWYPLKFYLAKRQRKIEQELRQLNIADEQAWNEARRKREQAEEGSDPTP